MPAPTKNRQARREALREELKSREYLRQIHKILNNELAEKDLPQNEILRMKTRMQGYFNLLSKTLPDVKAVELNAVLETQPKNREELEHALAQHGIDPRLIIGGGVGISH
jgi:hypothetical protein